MESFVCSFSVSSSISCSIFSQPSSCISGSGALKQLSVATIAERFCNFCKFVRVLVPTKPHT